MKCKAVVNSMIPALRGPVVVQIGYVRVSTNDQNTDLQRNALNCAGCELILKTNKRDQIRKARIKKLLRTLSEGDTLVVWKLDRTGRSIMRIWSFW